MDAEKIVRYAEGLGAQQVEVGVIQGSYNFVEAKNDRIERAASDSKTIVGVRILVDGGVGAAGGEVSGWRDVEFLVEAALSIARAHRGEGYPGFNPRLGRGGDATVYDKRVASMTVEDVASLLREAMSVMKKDGSVRVADAAAEAEETLFTYANSHGGPLDEKSTSLAFGYELSASTPEGEGTYSDYLVRVRLEEDRVMELAESGARRVLDAARAKPAETMRAAIVLEAREAAAIIGLMIAPAVSAEQVLENRSPLRDKLGEKVLSGRITIVDDPFLPWEPGSQAFDAEGHPAMRKNVFRAGVLETYLYDYYSAVRAGAESTGNAARPRPWSKTTPAPSNLVVEVAGAYGSLDELVSQVDRGVLVASTIGSWMSNPISGVVNATITLGYLIEKGSVATPVKGLTWGDNIYEALGDDRLIGAGGRPQCRGGVCVGALAIAEASLAGR